jgi:hypothetical protein
LVEQFSSHARLKVTHFQILCGWETGAKKSLWNHNKLHCRTQQYQLMWLSWLDFVHCLILRMEYCSRNWIFFGSLGEKVGKRLLGGCLHNFLAWWQKQIQFPKCYFLIFVFRITDNGRSQEFSNRKFNAPFLELLELIFSVSNPILCFGVWCLKIHSARPCAGNTFVTL